MIRLTVLPRQIFALLGKSVVDSRKLCRQSFEHGTGQDYQQVIFERVMASPCLGV